MEGDEGGDNECQDVMWAAERCVLRRSAIQAHVGFN